MAPYQYRPLQTASQEIRLVHLLPGAFNDSIKLRILHSPFYPRPEPPLNSSTIQVALLSSYIRYPWNLEETEGGSFIAFNVITGEMHPIASFEPSTEDLPDYQPRYDALSYVWGTAGISEFVQVEAEDAEANGTPGASLGVRPNLASALRHIRDIKDVRTLWIDAICINQEDMAERKEQVKRMAHIYNFAHRVIAWLGEESNNSKLSLATLQHIGRQLEVTKSGRLIAAPGATERRMWRNDHAPSIDQQTWQALRDFTERAWFYRLWCWQEIKLGGLGALLQCGNETVPWHDFWKAVLCLHNKDGLLSRRFRERCRHIVFLKYNLTGETMSNILEISRSKGCVDPRDKIYGLLGITPIYFSSRVVVDYLQPVESVYKDAFLIYLDATKRLDLMKQCDLAKRQIKGPSWVPDWSNTEFGAPILSEQLSSGMSRAWFTQPEPSVLEVVGTHYTVIKTVSEPASKLEEEALLAVRKWFQGLNIKNTYVTGESMEVAFALTLCMNRTRERHPSNHFKNVREWVEMLHKMLRLTEANHDDPLYSERETANTIQKVRGRRFFTTESGHIGTAPEDIQVGDSICLLLGTYAPMVLRRTPLDTFQVVGECYVHGLQDAQGIFGPLGDNWRAIIKGDSLGRVSQWFVNLRSGEETREDPRLGPLPPNWERATYERLADDPTIFEKFQNVETGELINYDPRLSPKALEALDVQLQSFKLV